MLKQLMIATGRLMARDLSFASIKRGFPSTGRCRNFQQPCNVWICGCEGVWGCCEGCAPTREATGPHQSWAMRILKQLVTAI